LQRSRDTNEDKGVKTLLQNIVMEEVQHEEEVHVLEGAPFLTRDAYEKEISRGTARELVVAAEQKADQQQQSTAGPFILEESVLEACPYSHGYADLPIFQPAFVPSPVIKKGEESSPSSFVSLSAQKKIPHSCPLNTEAEQTLMLKAKTDHLSLDILMSAQMVSTQIERAAYQITEEEDAQSWNSYLDVDCFKKNEGADSVPVTPTQEYTGSLFILVVQIIDDKDKYTAAMIIQQVYKGSCEELPRRKIHRREMKVDPFLPTKLKCPRLFEVEDQINHVLLIYDEPDDRQQF